MSESCVPQTEKALSLRSLMHASRRHGVARRSNDVARRVRRAGHARPVGTRVNCRFDRWFALVNKGAAPLGGRGAASYRPGGEEGAGPASMILFDRTVA
jgi:hypothetical protein